MPPAPARAVATLQPGDVQAVRVCAAEIPSLPRSGALEITADGSFGAGWHLAERGGSQRFRWSERQSTLLWRMEQATPVRMILRMRAANAKGATVTIAANGTPQGSCVLPAGAWTDCRIQIPENVARSGINQLTLTGDTISPSADRPGDARELSFEMQAGRVRIGQ
jgi:hypothetical protein